MGVYTINTGIPQTETPHNYTSNIVTAEGIFPFETVYIPFPKNPKIIKVGGFEVPEYATPDEIDYHINRIAKFLKQIKMGEPLVNEQGGKFLWEKVARINGYDLEASTTEVHRPKGGGGAEFTKWPPESIYGKQVTLFDDVKDSGGTGKGIMDLFDSKSVATYILTKFGIEKQIKLNNEVVAIVIDKVWVGGCGMDLGLDGEKDVFRKHGGLVCHPDTTFSL